MIASDRLAVVDVEPLAARAIPSRRESSPSWWRIGRVDVGHVVPVLDGVEADLVGRAVDDAALESAAGHPHARSRRCGGRGRRSLATRRAAELGREHHAAFRRAARGEPGPATGAATGWSTAMALPSWFPLRPPCGVPHAAAPPPCWTWMNRTPRSTRRRAPAFAWPNSRQWGRSRP